MHGFRVGHYKNQVWSYEPYLCYSNYGKLFRVTAIYWEFPKILKKESELNIQIRHNKYQLFLL